MAPKPEDVHLKPFQAVYPNFDLIASADSFFGTVKYDYRDFEKSGFFNKTEGEAIYIYSIVSPNRRHKGVVASVDINDYMDGGILRHENTLSTKEQSMTNLLLNRKAMIKPVLLTYPKKDSVDQLIEEFSQGKPLYQVHFDEDNEDHKIWKVDAPEDIERVIKAFGKIKKTYIADGHHRCSTSAMLYKSKNAKKLNLDFSTLLCTFLSFDQLVIHDYNRVLNVLDDISPLTFMAELSEYCYVKKMDEPFNPTQKHELSMFLEREWFRIRWRKKVLKEYKNDPVVLDATILTDVVVKKILKIKDVRSDKRIKYVSGVEGADGFVDACLKKRTNIGFGLFPVEIEEIKKLSDMGQVLPPKSTWFEPRMKNGLIAQEF